jgi:regulator of RNase E activity RraA
VAPADIVLGDDDGIAVVPLARAGSVLTACREKIAQEAEALRRLEGGETLADQMGIPEPDPAG